MLALKLGLSLPSSNSGSGAASFDNLYSLAFDGVDDYVNIGDADVLTPNDSGANRGFSVSFWFKCPSKTEILLAKSNEYTIWFDYDRKVRMQLFSGGGLSIYRTFSIDTIASYDIWHNITISWNLGNTDADMIGYLDGVKHSVALGNASWADTGSFVSVSNTDKDLLFGRYNANYAEMNFDEVALFDSALSDSESTLIYNGGTPDNLSSIDYLIGWWRNGDTAGTSVYPTITDDSSNSNDGTMTNMDSGDIVTDVP